MQMTDWTRVIWASDDARLVWEPRIQSIQRAWAQVELQSVEQRARYAGLVFGRPQTKLPCIEVAPNRFAFGPYAASLALAYTRGNNDTIGELLGYPECCRAFFNRTWGSGALDTTAQMAGYGNGPVECNIMGRWIGVRCVPHLPCSWTCEYTRAFAYRLADLWPKSEYAWAREILGWSMDWSALHGIAEIVMPVLKVSTRTTYTSRGQAVRRHGSLPTEGASGLIFPFHQPTHVLRFDRRPKSVPQDNGFATMEAMETSHNMVLDTLATSPPQGLTLDLGCGNGHLQRRVSTRYGVPVLGVEIDRDRAGLYPDILILDMRNLPLLPASADTILVSQRRFEEIPELETWCLGHARQVLVYSYDAPVGASFRKAS